MKGPDDRGGVTADTHTLDTPRTVATRRFPASATSVGQARRFLARPAPGPASDEEADSLVLMVSELATNAVQHAATEFEVAVHVAPDGATSGSR